MTYTEEEFDDIVALAVRRVQTPEGAKKFGQPIGTVITADMIKKANAKSGTGGKVDNSDGVDTSKGDKSSKSEFEDGAKEWQESKPDSSLDNEPFKDKKGDVEVTEPSLSGPNIFKVGESTFSAPAGSKLIRPKNKKNMAYVVTADGTVHAFNESGEVPVPDYLQETLSAKFSSLKADDTLYSVEEFDESLASALADQKPGAILSVNGKPVFTKKDETTWENTDIGVTLTDDDLQPQFDAGKFELIRSEAAPESTDFSKMTKDELVASLESFEVGKKVIFDSTGIEGNAATLIKKDNGNWVNEKLKDTGEGIAPDALADLVVGTSWLSEESDVAENAPAELSDPIRSKSGGKTLTDQAMENIPTGDEIVNSEVGDIVFHDSAGILKKTSENNWRSEEGTNFPDGSVTESAELGFISKTPWNPDQEKAQEKYVKEQEKTKKDSEASKPTEPTPKDNEEPEDDDSEETSVPEGAVLVKDISELEAMIPGDSVYVDLDGMSTSKFTLNDEGEWDSPDSGVPFSMADLQYDVDAGNAYVEPKNTDSKEEIAEKTAQEKELFESFVPDEPEDNPEGDEPAFDAATYAKKSLDEIFEDYPEVGREIHDTAELNDAPVGTVIRTIDIHYGETIAFIKGDDEKWYMGGEEHPYSFNADQFKGEIEEDDFAVNFLKPKVAEKETDPFLDLLAAQTPKTSTPSDDDDPVSGISKADRESAVAALEAHSGFQVKYGLKSLPDTHPLKDEKNLEDELDAAKASYPGLSPKQALIAYLKGEKPTEALADWELELLGGEDVVQIGSEKSKNTQTGLTGGSFTKKEIQEAIDILENFQGKVFKAELNKKGNPLGKLSPNDIVGFNKDKTITKQKFLDLLKSKIADTEAPEEIQEVDTKEETSPTPEMGETVTSIEQMDAMEVGTKLVWTSPTLPDDSHSYLKTEAGWVGPDGGVVGLNSFLGSIMNGHLTYAGVGEANPTEDVPDAPASEDDQAILTSSALEFMDNGSNVYTADGHYFTKVSDNAWIRDGKPENEFSDNHLASLNPTLSPTGSPTQENQTPEYSHGDRIKDSEEFKNLPIGTQVDDSFGNIYTKASEGIWHTPSDEGMESVSDLDFQGAILNGSLTIHAPEPESKGLKVGDSIGADFDMNTLAVGTQIESNYGSVYTKSDNGWDTVSGPFSNDTVHNGVKVSANDGHPYKIKSLPSSEASPIEETKKTEYTEFELSGLSQNQVKNFPVGQVFQHSQGKNVMTKVASDNWEITAPTGEYVNNWTDYKTWVTFTDYGGWSSPSSDDSSLKLPEVGSLITSLKQLQSLPMGHKVKTTFNGVVWTVKSDGNLLSDTGTIVVPAMLKPTIDLKTLIYSGLTEDSPVVESPHGISPGIYNTGKGAKAKLFINPDGTGVYKGMKNITKPLDADGVKKNFDAGMNKFVSDLPPEGAPDAVTPQAVASKPVGSLNDLADGTYYYGVPGEAKTIAYTVQGDDVQVAKPLVEWNSSKLSQKITQNFLDTSPEGAQISSEYFGLVLTKKDGQWVDKWGENYTNHSYLTHGYYQSKFKIKKIGTGETTSAKKTSLKTKFLKGQLLDSEGTSVMPSNYSGTMKYYGVETNVISLAKAHKEIQESDGVKIGTILNSYGIKANALGTILDKIVQKYGENTPGNQKEWFDESLSNLLSGVDTSVPEGKTTELFQFDELGHAEVPAKLAEYQVPGYYSKSVGELTQDVKNLAALFGDGTFIGQLPTTMNKNQKVAWLSNVKKGDFKSAYTIELQAAANSGKSMPKGWMHPGYPDNTETHQVKWQSAVPGEIPAGQVIEGSWSSNNLQWSMAEVDNYLIKAQMQNPEYLDAQEKRNWVKWHISGLSNDVNNYSILAQSRKNQGYDPVSPEPVWTDDIIPAKSYDHLFEGTQYPQNWGYEKQAALDWYNDNVDKIPELVTSMEQIKDNYDTAPWNDVDSYSQKNIAVQVATKYFKQKEEAYQAELLKPVYTKESGQTKGSHPGAFYTDQFGNKFYMKWWDNEDQLSNYRLEIEHAGNKIGRAFGFKTADSKLIKQDGHYGQLQNVVAGVGDMTNFDYSSITPQMVADIEGEHMLDWMLQNDDTKADNAIVTADGRIVGIDKARSFKDYGVVNWDHNAPDGNQSVYTRLYSAVKAGQISKETMDAAYLKARLTASRMQKQDNKKFFDLIEEGSKNRTSWTVSYKIDGKSVSQDLDGLKAAFADQKSKLSEKLDAEWTKLYKDAGLGDLPEPPKKPLGEGVISGFEDSELYENMAKTKAHGTATLVNNGSVIGGTVLTWQDKTKDKDEVNLNGEFYLAPKAQEAMLIYLTANATDLSGTKTEVTHFQGQDNKWDGILSMAKTVNQHATDGAYNENTVAAFEKIRTDIESELAEWTPNLTANSTSPGGLEAYKFKSGKVMPLLYIDQYKLMLDYYQPMVEEIHVAHTNKVKTGTYEKYTALEFDTSSKKYSNPDGESMTKMANGQWIFNSGESVALISDTMAQTALSDGGWAQDNSDSPELPSNPVKIVKLGYTHEREATVGDGGSKETNYASGGAINGSGGQEFEVTLPTGEKIYFRNAGHTSTKRGQQGRITFHARGQGDVDSSPAAMQNILDQLSTMGISLEASEHEDAELTYWREMYGVLVNRNTSDSPKHASVLKEMEKKRTEIGSTPENFLEELSGKMTASEQNAFWRDIWAKHFGQDRVDKLISEEGYLPKYDHQNYQHAEVGTGKPYWERFDVDIEDIYAQNVIIASTLGKTPKDLVKAGGALGAEERLRQLSDFHAGASWSAASDQGKGSSHNIYTRLKGINSGELSSFDAFYSPKVMLRTRTYSFSSDNYGALDNRKSGSPANPVDAMKEFQHGGSNETMLPHMATFLDTIEFYAFEDAKEREEMIQHLKSLGLEMIRGLPIEDRLVMRKNVKAAIEKVKKTWTEQN